MEFESFNPEIIQLQYLLLTKQIFQCNIYIFKEFNPQMNPRPRLWIEIVNKAYASVILQVGHLHCHPRIGDNDQRLRLKCLFLSFWCEGWYRVLDGHALLTLNHTTNKTKHYMLQSFYMYPLILLVHICILIWFFVCVVLYITVRYLSCWFLGIHV